MWIWFLKLFYAKANILSLGKHLNSKEWTKGRDWWIKDYFQFTETDTELNRMKYFSF